MSDTTITPEERQGWRDMFEMVKKNPSQHGMIIPQNGMPMERLLNALEQAEDQLNGCGEDLKRAATLAEQAEARADELEEYIAKLVCELTDGRLSEPYDISVITDEVESIYRAYYEDEISKATAKAEAERKKDLAHCKFEFERAEDAEADNARLLAQINALLECRKAEKSLASLTRINEGIKGGWIEPWKHEGLPKKLLKARERVKIARQSLEAALRAVAAGEE